MLSPMEIKLPMDKSKLYIPVYTYDDVDWKALEPTFYLPAAKSRLCSHLPQEWMIKAVPEKYRKVRCGIGILQLGKVEAQLDFIEFQPEDFLGDRIALGPC